MLRHYDWLFWGLRTLFAVVPKSWWSLSLWLIWTIEHWTCNVRPGLDCWLGSSLRPAIDTSRELPLWSPITRRFWVHRNDAESVTFLFFFHRLQVFALDPSLETWLLFLPPPLLLLLVRLLFLLLFLKHQLSFFAHFFIVFINPLLRDLRLPVYVLNRFFRGRRLELLLLLSEFVLLLKPFVKLLLTLCPARLFILFLFLQILTLPFPLNNLILMFFAFPFIERDVVNKCLLWLASFRVRIRYFWVNSGLLFLLSLFELVGKPGLVWFSVAPKFRRGQWLILGWLEQV